MKGLSFPYLKNTTTKSKNRTASESTCLVMKKDNHFPFTSPKKSLKTNEPTTNHRGQKETLRSNK